MGLVLLSLKTPEFCSDLEGAGMDPVHSNRLVRPIEEEVLGSYILAAV